MKKSVCKLSVKRDIRFFLTFDIDTSKDAANEINEQCKKENRGKTLTYTRTRTNGGGKIPTAFLENRGISKKKCDFSFNLYVILTHFVLIVGFS